MNDLKTLKDIEFNAGLGFMKYHKLRATDPFVTKEDLKKEAIKWVKKHFEKEWDCHFGYDTIENEDEKIHIRNYCQGFVLMKFFNLTEEDLK